MRLLCAAIVAAVVVLTPWWACSQGIYICQGGNCPPSLNGITLSNSTFNSGAVSGTVVGNLSVLTSGSPFSGSYGALGGADAAKFQIANGTQLATNGVVTAAGSTQTYNITVTANQASAVNSTITVPMTVMAQQVPTGVIYTPPSPITVLDNITTATTISTISVATGDGHAFFGITTLTANAGGRVALSGSNIVPAHNFTSADDGNNLTVTVQATENGTTVSANLTLNVNSAANITGVTVGGTTTVNYTSGVASGSSLGAIAVAETGGVFGGTIALGGTAAADFAFSNTALPANLLTNSLTPTCTTQTNYSITITPTQSGVGNSGTAYPITVTCIPSSGGGGVAFTALHTYYMSPTGNDSNNGTSAATPWASPNHSVVCGDVIIAATGAYSGSNGLQSFGTVSGCPSTSGGIDGAGGIYFATMLCAGNVGACSISWTGSGAAIDIASSNWAVEGWRITSTSGRSFQVDACASGTTIRHHVAFINDISATSQQGYDINECANNHNVPGNGTDYWAVVGSIAQNSANDPICLGAIDAVAPANFDSGTGTHIFFYGDFSIANREPGSCSDGEGILLDTWDAHGYTGQGVFQNNISVGNGRYGVQIFDQAFNKSTPHIFILNNTIFDNAYNTGSDGDDGEINAQVSTNSPWAVTIQNNIARTRLASQGSTALHAILIGNPSAAPGSMTVGGTGTQNIAKALTTSCGGSCDAGHNVVAYNGASFGTNTYVDPAFTNTADLTANRYGTPSCGTFVNVTQCMGWNAGTSTLTTPSVISDMVPTAAGTTSDGYQLPSTTCAANSFYPTWLKGIVYLQWNSSNSTISENADLVTKPCGV